VCGSSEGRAAKPPFFDRDTTALAPKEPAAVYLLTGTPLTNRPRDLFVLLQLAGHPLGRSFLSFAKRYCAAEKTQYGWKTDGASNLKELTVQLHGTMLRRAKEDVLSLPPKLRTWLPTTVAAGIAAREIREVVTLLLARRSGTSVASDARSRTDLLSLLTKARQKLAVAKIDTTLDLVRGAVEQGEKVIVFSCFDDPVQTLAKAFGSQAVVLTGKVPSAKRQGLVDRFQHDDKIRVFLANIIAGGTGLTLTAATQWSSTIWTGSRRITGRQRTGRIEWVRREPSTSLTSLATKRSTSLCRRCSKSRPHSSGPSSMARHPQETCKAMSLTSSSGRWPRSHPGWPTRLKGSKTRC
jgi:hypothetical protein